MLYHTDWEALLVGDAQIKTHALTRSGDPAWFDYPCRTAVEAKHATWLRYKWHPSHHNKARHRDICKRMTAVYTWARNPQREHLKRKLCGPGVGNQTWWSLVKEWQGTSHIDAVPPLYRPDKTSATSSGDKASLFAKLFSNKMKVDDLGRSPPKMALETHRTVTTVSVTTEQVEWLLSAVDVTKVNGPNDINPQLLKQCATVFTSCLKENKWPLQWKEARVVPVHKKNLRSEPSNYRPVSLFSVVGKLLERIVVEAIYQHLSENHLLSDRQFGLRASHSTSDLLLLLFKDWWNALDESLDTLVVALDIAGAFDSVWHMGLVENLRA